SALAGRDDLDRVKAEYGDVAVAAVADGFEGACVARAAGERGLVLRADRVGSILDDLESVPFAQRVNARHIAGLPAVVHRDHDFRKPTLPLRLDELFGEARDANVVGTRI